MAVQIGQLPCFAVEEAEGEVKVRPMHTQTGKSNGRIALACTLQVGDDMLKTSVKTCADVFVLEERRRVELRCKATGRIVHLAESRGC